MRLLKRKVKKMQNVEIKEIWKSVPGVIHHQVSNLGRVRCVAYKRKLGCVRIMPTHITRYGEVVTIGKKPHTVHNLMARAFLGGRVSQRVRHLDGDIYNNILENLELVG